MDGGKSRIGRSPEGQRGGGGEQDGARCGTGGHRQDVANGSEAPVLQRQAERDAGQQKGQRTKRDGPQGCHAGADGSASQRATGTERAATPPSRATLTAMRIQERAAAMPGI